MPKKLEDSDEKQLVEKSQESLKEIFETSEMGDDVIEAIVHNEPDVKPNVPLEPKVLEDIKTLTKVVEEMQFQTTGPADVHGKKSKKVSRTVDENYFAPDTKAHVDGVYLDGKFYPIVERGRAQDIYEKFRKGFVTHDTTVIVIDRLGS